MVDERDKTGPSRERRVLLSRKSEQDQFVEEFRNFRKEFRALRKKLDACDQLSRVAKELEDFLKNTSEIAAAQERQSILPDEDKLIVQAKALAQSGSERSRGSILSVYKKMIRPVPEISAESMTDDKETALRMELAMDLPRRFKETLDSSLPQLEILLKKFYPGESPADLDKRELRFLRGVAQYVRLERGGAQRSKAFDGMALPVGGVRDMLGSQQSKEFFVNGLLEVLIQTSPVCAELKQDLSGEKVSLAEVQRLQANYERDHAILMHSKNVRKAEYRVWLIERAGERKRVAGSPADIDDLDSIDRAHQIGNKVGGVILYGPPGTGKTEKIIESNRRNGFDTHLISMHRHSDFAQLMGEAPVFLEGLDQTAGKVQKVEAFQRMLSQPDEKLKRMLTDTPALYEKLVKLTPRTKLQMESQNLTQPNEELLSSFLTELRGAVNQQLVDLFVSDDEGDKDTAWANGEIQRAINEGKMALLDEGDKASSTAFDGISAVLSKRPGESVSLGGQEVTFPHWFRIDMTVNQTNLPEHIRDRFTPIEINYPQTEDLLWKLGLFLSDEQGDLKVDVGTEWQMTLFFSHVVPRIHELYAKVHAAYEKKAAKDPHAQLDMFPFSMRGISTFCSRVAAGEPLDRVIEEEILRGGKLAVEGSEPHKKLLKYVQAFARLTDRLVFTNEQSSNTTGVGRLVESPLYNTIAASEATHEIAQERTLSPVDISREQHQKLSASETRSEAGTEYRLASGALVTQEKLDNAVRFNYSYQSGSRTVTYFSTEYSTLKDKVKIIDADLNGEHLSVQQDTEFFVIAPMNAALAAERTDDALLPGAKDGQLSKDGEYVAGVKSCEGIVVPAVEIVGRSPREFVFISEGYRCEAKRTEMSEDGSTVVIEAFDGRVYVAFPEREESRVAADSTEIQVNLDQKELKAARGVSGWKFSGRMLWAPESDTAFIIS